MKKLGSLLLALMLSVAMHAQLLNGSVAPNFIATDLNGNTWNLYDILDQGKSVVLNFSATWAPPCWNYNNSNILEQYYQLHGPAGDNTSMVLWIEGDITTGVDCITGSANCGSGTQGDFTAGKTHPFIDDTNGSISADYEIAYYPTIFIVCSDKIITEVGQGGLGQLEAEAALCPVIVSTTKVLFGSVVKDDNGNCMADTGELPLANWGVTATGQNGSSVSTVSKANGIFKFYVDSLNSPYTLSFTPPNALWASCAPDPTVVATAADTIWANHAAQVLIPCPQLTTEIGTPLLRRCFANNFYVEVCNDGSEMATDAYVDITLPTPGFTPVLSSGLPYFAVANNVYRFTLGNIQIGECVNFSFQAAVSCDSAYIGQTLCFEAHAYPDSICQEPNAAWNGATVAVTANCENGVSAFTITNTGTGPMSEQLNYIVIEDDVMRSEGFFQLNPGQSIPIVVENNGSTWRVEALQVPNHPVSGNPSAALEGCTVLNNFSTGFILGYATYDPSPAYDIECMMVVGSWDPNDKTGFPLGVTDQHLIAKNTDLDYLIRFQNTGTDTAFTVVVRDTLPAQLDAKTIRLGAASHAYDYTLEEGNIMVFNFKDIKLVDSFANEPASHGFLRFKIAQQPNLTDNTVINNSAAIYFDFNEPVITNTSVHRIGEIAHVSLVNSTLSKNYELTVYPNPLNGAVSLYTKNEMPVGATWALYDFSGKRLDSGVMNGNAALIGAKLKDAGLYYIEFRNKAGQSLGGATIKH